MADSVIVHRLGLKSRHNDIQPAESALGDEPCTLGRAPRCSVQIPRALVSRLHAQIRPYGPRYQLVDEGSSNGTFVNGSKIVGPHVLNGQDLIGLGSPAPLLQFLDPDPTARPLHRLRFDETRQAFLLNDMALDLTPQELRLLQHLYRHAGIVCTRVTCAEAIWPDAFRHDPTLETEQLTKKVSDLRMKLREIAPDADLLKTMRNVGYMLDL